MLARLSYIGLSSSWKLNYYIKIELIMLNQRFNRHNPSKILKEFRILVKYII